MMSSNRKFSFIIIIAVCVLFSFSLISEENMTLKALAESVETYRGQEIEMLFRLRNHSEHFKTITFYDKNNHDIVFDISDRRKDKIIKSNLRTMHEGSIYRVIFTVEGIDSKGKIQGRIKSFTMELLERLP
ncbi:MAG TPA: hypothetical protein PLA54_01080 [Spirochaetota bacterium]|nr:hypothetical protein [Spirochaetota bacterium]HQE57763.1 hypothetical protein [Spirochaetota bacterium]